MKVHSKVTSILHQHPYNIIFFFFIITLHYSMNKVTHKNCVKYILAKYIRAMKLFAIYDTIALNSIDKQS